MENILKRDLAADYRILLSWRYNRVEFLGLPNLKENRPLTLDEIYVPLSFTWRPGAKEERFYLPKALTESRHLVALGDPGSGKSTLVKLITYLFGRSQPSSLQQRFGPLLPVPIILRDYNVRRWKSYGDMLRDFIGGLDEKIRDDVTVEWLKDHLRGGKAILLLDGIDEVGRRNDRKHLRDRIINPLLKEMPESYSILTSRIVGYEEVPFDREADFNRAKARITQRNRQAKANILRDIPASLFAPRRCYVAPFDDKNIEEFIARWYATREEDPERQREGFESLRRALNQNDRVKRLATNPSLLTLMALVHRVTAQLPSGRVKLYDKIVEAYLETIDRYRKLGQYPASLEQMKRWLARVGWEMQSRRDLGEETELLVSRPDTFKWLYEAIAADSRPNPEEEAGQFLDWVERRSGLLVERGSGQYSFVHLTFQEYFAAFHLRGQLRRFDKLAETCAELAVKAHWHETLCVLFEMLAEFPGAGDDLLDELKSHAEKTEEDSDARRWTAELFSSLLLDEENCLSDVKRAKAATFALEVATGDSKYLVIENLKQLSPERLETFVVQWFDKELIKGRFGKYFFITGAQLINNWTQRLGDWIEQHDDVKLNEIQMANLTRAGAGDRRVCDWSTIHLPIQTWFQNDFGGLSLADIYRSGVYELSERLDVSARHRLLAQACAASGIIKLSFIRVAILLWAADGNLTHELARELELHLDRTLYSQWHRFRARVLYRDLARSIAHILARGLTIAIGREKEPYLAQAYALGYTHGLTNDLADTHDLAHALSSSLSKESTTEITLHQLIRRVPQNNDRTTQVFRSLEMAFFFPETSIKPVITQALQLAGAKDDWTRLIAVSALLMLGEGTLGLYDERNALLDKGIKQSYEFTFPPELRPETETEDFRKQLSKILDLIFLHTPGDRWLKRELFDPANSESRYFLSKPREFFILAADTLDPEGKTELSQWRKRLAGE